LSYFWRPYEGFRCLLASFLLLVYCLLHASCVSASPSGVNMFLFFLFRGCPTSGVAQRAMREDAPHGRGMSKARQL
jgi:hypothetical protein